jgi:dihydroorotate dehydrogenase (NAD+) catalytic subunit
MSQRMENWLYDPALSYADNMKQGPSGDFDNQPPYQNIGEPQYDFFGTKVYSPFGIAAGPLTKAQFVKSALDRGYDIVTFKSVRTGEYPCHPLPNVTPIEIDELDPHNTDNPIVAKSSYKPPLTLANSFGVPSYAPEIWQKEMKQSFNALGLGQAMLVAFQGTDRGKGHKAFIEDHVKGTELLKEAGATVVEVNLSCPNEGSPQLLCFDIDTTRQIIEKIRVKDGNTKIIVKITYFSDKNLLRKFVQQIGPLVDGIIAINTIGTRVVNKDGSQFFPGDTARAKPGISGHALRPMAIAMVARLASLREEFSLDFKIIGVGGVQTPEDFHAHRNAGADFVMGLTGVMWNPRLAAEIKESLTV